LLIDNKCHNSGRTIFGGKCHQSESGDHISVDDIIVFSARRGRALLGENS
jgi:hypothetical protein